MLSKEMKEAIIDCAKVIRKKGWKTAEPLIREGIKKFGPDFPKWCGALIEFRKKISELN